jgi:ethanolamine ammonia-lyase small subunit
MSKEEYFWDELKQYTSARIGLKRSGSSISTKQLLEFQLAHARAKDAVHEEVNFEKVREDLETYHLPVEILSSRATSKSVYLQRPDLGRLLSDESADKIKAKEGQSFDISLVIGDGLSAFAIHHNIKPFFEQLIPKLQQHSFIIAPVALVRYARVAVGDEIGRLQNSKMVIVFIGERPGLSSPDSLGVYLTYNPQSGLTDEKRNCISNIRTGGLPFLFATEKLMYLISEAFRRRLSGIDLKDDLYLKLEE